MQPQLAEILNHPTDILALLDPINLSLIACNESFETYFSIDIPQSVGREIFDIIGTNVPQENRYRIKKQLSDKLFCLETDLIENHHFYFNLTYTDPSPCVLLRVSSLLQNSEAEQYHQLFQRNLAGVYKATLDGRIISCNSAFAKIVGYTNTEDLTGINTVTLYKNPQHRKGFLQQIRTQKQVLNYEVEVMRKDGTTATCLENACLEKRVEEEETVSGILIDISAMKLMERELQDSEVRYKTLAAVSGESVVFSRDGLVVDCNEQFAKLFGYIKPTEVMGQKLTAFINAQDIKRVRTTLEISEHNQVEIRTFDRNGKAIFVEIRGSQMRYRGKDTIVFVITDNTSRKRIEHALEQSVVRFRNLLENSPNGVVILTDEKIRYLNHAACMLFDVLDEDEVFETPFVKFVDSTFKNEIKLDLTHIRNGGEVDYREIKLRSATGRELDIGIKSTLTVYENKPSLQVTLNNLTDRKQLVQEQVRVRLIEEINTVLKTEIEEHKITQKKLKAQEREAVEQRAKLESIINSTENLMMWTVDTKHRVTTMNRNFVVWMKEFYGEDVALGKDIMKMLKKHVDPDFYQGQLTAFDLAFKGRPQQVEFALKNTSGQTVWLQAFLNPINMDGNLEQISCLVYDNTERRQIDRMVLDSLKEKEVLLKEVHHRVKNNLQIISSILNLQSGYVTDPGTLTILQESQQRIKSMSFLHETLYRTSDFSKLEFTQYISTIVSNLLQSYRNTEQDIRLETHLDEVYLSLDQSIPCGLIVNELVSNAMKYAWKGRKKGVLTATLKEKAGGCIQIIIADDGVGLPKTFLYDKNDSLGIQLVYTLLEQVDAKLDIKTSSKGTTFAIEFVRG